LIFVIISSIISDRTFAVIDSDSYEIPDLFCIFFILSLNQQLEHYKKRNFIISKNPLTVKGYATIHLSGFVL